MSQHTAVMAPSTSAAVSARSGIAARIAWAGRRTSASGRAPGSLALGVRPRRPHHPGRDWAHHRATAQSTATMMQTAAMMVRGPVGAHLPPPVADGVRRL